MIRLIDDLLDLQKLRLGKMRLDIEPIDVRPIDGAAVSDFRMQAVSQSVELKWEGASRRSAHAADADLRQGEYLP